MSWPTGEKSFRVEVEGFDMPEANFGFTIDYSKLDEEMAREVVEFHIDKDELRFEAGGDLHKMLMLKITQWAYRWALKQGYNAHGLNAEFDDAEGWPPAGAIKFTTAHIDEIEICMSEVTITEK